jgi:hypothetical protein
MGDYDDAILRAIRNAPKHQRGRIRAACPICEEERGKLDRRQALSIDQQTGLWYCWRCATGGKLHDMEGVVLAPATPQGELERQIAEARANAARPPQGYVALGEEPYRSALSYADARAYANKRFITDDMMVELQIGVTLEGYYANRIIAPILDDDLLFWSGWIGRDFTGFAEKKYLYPRGMPRGERLYNHGALDVVTDEPVLIVEGFLDVMPYYPDASAVLGKPSRMQRAAMLAAKRPIVFVLDGDAWQESHALHLRLQFDGQRSGSVRLPPKLDPDDLARSHGVEYLRDAARAAVGKFDPVRL